MLVDLCWISVYYRDITSRDKSLSLLFSYSFCSFLVRFRARTSSTRRKQFPLLRENFAALSWANLTFRSSAPEDSPPLLEGLSRPHNRPRAAGGPRRNQTTTRILLFSIRPVIYREINYESGEFRRSAPESRESHATDERLILSQPVEIRVAILTTALEIDEARFFFFRTVEERPSWIAYRVSLKRSTAKLLRFDKFFHDMFATRGLSGKNPQLTRQSIFIIHRMHEIW